MNRVTTKSQGLFRTDETAAGAAASGRPTRWLASWTRRAPVLPVIVYLVLVTQAPFLLTVFYSTQSWNLLDPTAGRRFIGLDNYLSLGNVADFGRTVANTAILTASVIVASLVLGLLVALLLNRQFPARRLVRTLLITPFLIMPTVNALIWKDMIFNPVYGLLNAILSGLRMARVDLLAQQPMLAIIIICVWSWTPFMMLILLAGLQSLDNEMVEAAQMDGAGPLALFRAITVPHLSPYLGTCTLLGTIMVLPTFGEIYVATYGGPGLATTNLTFGVFKVAFADYNIGGASALAIVTMLITMAIGLTLMRTVGRVFTKELRR
jgi:sorbitol/mannitol transport system permease protein